MIIIREKINIYVILAHYHEILNLGKISHGNETLSVNHEVLCTSPGELHN